MRPRPTVTDLCAPKGKRRLTMLRCVTLGEAAAAEQAGIEQREFGRFPAGIGG